MKRKVKIRKIKPIFRLFKRASTECEKEIHEKYWEWICLRCTVAIHANLGSGAVDRLLDQSGLFDDKLNFYHDNKKIRKVNIDDKK